MSENDEDTGSLTLRRVRLKTIDELYEAKYLTGLPLCQLVDDIVYLGIDEYVRQWQLDDARRLAREFGADDATPLITASGRRPQIIRHERLSSILLPRRSGVRFLP